MTPEVPQDFRGLLKESTVADCGALKVRILPVDKREGNVNKTKIEWCDYTWNPIKGYCPNDCPYCYAHRMYDRFGWDKTLRLDEKELEAPAKLKKPSRIFVGSMIDMYHPDISRDWVFSMLNESYKAPWHTYISLTKFPRLYDYYVYTYRWWIGVTIEDRCRSWRQFWLKSNINAEVTKFISFEPLLTNMYRVPIQDIDWIIIGGLTPSPVHKKAWIDDIVKRADALQIPIFIKDNAHYPIKRQEFPKEKK